MDVYDIIISKNRKRYINADNVTAVDDLIPIGNKIVTRVKMSCGNVLSATPKIVLF